MRSVEASLHALATTLGVSFPSGVQLQDWINLTEKIDKEIGVLEKQARSPQKTEQLKRFSKLLLPANCFRLAWRNHVAHAREKYEAEEARKVLLHVGDFLKELSQAL